MSTQIYEKKIIEFLELFDSSNSILAFSSCLPKQAKENKETRMLLEVVIVVTRWYFIFPLAFLPSWFNSQEVT
jgi:hypothetical protein